MDSVDYSASQTAISCPTQHRLDWESRCFFSKVISGPRGRVFKSHHSDHRVLQDKPQKSPETVYSYGFRAFLFICGFRYFSVVTHTVTHTGISRFFFQRLGMYRTTYFIKIVLFYIYLKIEMNGYRVFLLSSLSSFKKVVNYKPVID